MIPRKNDGIAIVICVMILMAASGNFPEKRAERIPNGIDTIRISKKDMAASRTVTSRREVRRLATVVLSYL